ncbi:MAG TPA: 6-phosphogluconolactonase [Micromonospora sp.]|nr:6-phosphogluconolactonase [Micromonospora sp.]
MHPDVTVFPNAVTLGHALAEEICKGIVAASADRRPYIIGCPGGRTGRSTYHALATLVREHALSLDHVIIAMMDDYVTDGAAGPTHVPDDAHYSCRKFARDDIVRPINAGANTGIPAANIWFPDPAQPADYDRRLQAAGGIDLFLLASGESDGHVAFNPPGSARDSRTRIIQLADSTRRDNLHTFPHFASLDEVPTAGVTVGISTIADLSRELVLIVTGQHKRDAFRRTTSATDYQPDWPATVVAAHHRGRILADADAAAR